MNDYAGIGTERRSYWMNTYGCPPPEEWPNVDGYREADDDEFGISRAEMGAAAVGCGVAAGAAALVFGAVAGLYGALRRILS